ncbi:MAG: CoA ester lyase [Thermoanaerobacteraceae bacterium]|nr:CoA ester lyase [Thermoanaerobacteraceae bacterium]
MFRTMLFAPGNNERRMQKALSLPADAVIFDLEDAVALNEKKNAREMVCSVLSQARQRKVFIRINSLDTPYAEEDLQKIIPMKPDGIMVPKAEHAEGICRISEIIDELEKQENIALGHVKLIPLVETAAGVLNAYQIAGASGRVICLAFGAIDFTLDIGTGLSDEGSELAYARSHLVVASRAAGIGAPVDTVYPNIKDQEGLRQDTLRAKQLGMFGKLVIHPDQIPVVNEIYTPDDAEIAFAKKVVRAFREAEEQGVAAIQVDGKFVDYPVAVRAENILKLAAIIGK